MYYNVFILFHIVYDLDLKFAFLAVHSAAAQLVYFRYPSHSKNIQYIFIFLFNSILYRNYN